MTKYATTKEKNYYDKQVQNFHNRYIQRRSQELDQGGDLSKPKDDISTKTT